MSFILFLNGLYPEDREFLLDLFSKYGRYMYKVAYDVLHNKDDAEDAVQDSMCKIIKYLSKFRGNTDNEIRNKVVICIRSIVKNKAIDNYNKRKKRSERETGMFFYDIESEEEIMLFGSETADENADVEKAVLESERARLVRAALLELPQGMQDAVNLVYMCGYSHAETADFLAINENAVRARLFKARKYLKRILEKEMTEQ